MQISDGFFTFLYCRGWTYASGVRNPNGILGVLIRQNFPGLLKLLGDDLPPQPGLFWEHYIADEAPSNMTVNGVQCHNRADMVLNGFWVICFSHNENLRIA